jgi:hypothetical protein
MEKSAPSDRDPSSLILGQDQHNQDSGSVEATNRRSLVGTACSFLKELKKITSNVVQEEMPKWSSRKAYQTATISEEDNTGFEKNGA